jgi:hypothetical protein
MSQPTNREQRRHPEKLEQLEHEAEHGGQPPPDLEPNAVPDEQMRKTDRTQDDLSVRAKNSGHGKKTADKWNQ